MGTSGGSVGLKGDEYHHFERTTPTLMVDQQTR